jgi:hypothetical protein
MTYVSTLRTRLYNKISDQWNAIGLSARATFLNQNSPRSLMPLWAVGFVLGVLGLVCPAEEPVGSANEEETKNSQVELIGHWEFKSDAEDSSMMRLKSTAKALMFDVAGANGKLSNGASFDGASSLVEVPDANRLAIGTSPFSIATWVYLDEDIGDTVGDLISCYDPKERRGFHLGIYNHGGVTNSQPNLRQVHFGIDQGRTEREFRDHGQLGDAVYVFSLCVHDGKLYASTCHSGNEQTGRVFRWEGDAQWKDLGIPTSANAVSALAVYNGILYAASAKYRLAGSGLSESTNTNFGGEVYRLGKDDVWENCGRVSAETEAIASLVVFRGKLYASSLYRPAGFFRYEGGTQWAACETPEGKRTEALTVFNNALYATCYDEGSVFRFDGQKWKTVGNIPGATQTYGFGIHRGELYVSEWPNAHVYRYRKELDWIDTGKLGQELEAMPLLIYNGKMYGGTLPLAEIYRYDGDNDWKLLGRVDSTPNVKYRRAWSMAAYQGRLFIGTLPSGCVKSLEAGKNVTYDQALTTGWHHIAATRSEKLLKLYIDGKLVAESSAFEGQDYDLTVNQPLQIGFGAQDFFRGRLADVRIYRGELLPNQLQRISSSKP